MKILFCSPGLSFLLHSGQNTRLRANSMASAGLDVTVVGFPTEYPSSGKECQFQYVSVFGSQLPSRQKRWLLARLRLGAYWTYILEPFRVMRFALREAARRGFDLIYIADVEPWLLLPLVCLRPRSKKAPPILAVIYDIYYEKEAMRGRPLTSKTRGWLNRTAARWLPTFTHVICENRHLTSLLKIEHHPHVRILPEGYENPRQEPTQEEARSALRIPPHKRMLLLFGVASRAKGADLLLQALEGVPPNFMVYLVGQTGGVYQESWGSLDRLHELGWSENLHVISRFVNEEEMANFFAASDAVVFPYRYRFVTSSANLRQATEYGKAVIASDQFWLGEVVRAHHLGLVFPPGDVEGLRRCLLDFVVKPDAWFTEIRFSSARLLQEQSWEKVGHMYRKLFLAITRSRAERKT